MDLASTHLRHVGRGIVALLVVVLAIAVAPFGVRAAQATIAGPVGPGAVVDDPGCTQHALARNDDESAGPYNLGFTINWFGTNYSSLWVNNNGGVNLQANWFAYSGVALGSIHQPVIAPLFTDLDTTDLTTSVVTYGTIADYHGHVAFCANWVNVGHYDRGLPKYSAQLLLVDRSDVEAGAIDTIFNYNWIDDASEAVTVGYAAASGTAYEFPGSRVQPSTLIDGNVTNGLVNHTLSSGGQLGRYTFPVRGGFPPSAQTIAFNDPGDHPLTDSPITLDAIATSGLTVTYTASGACSATADQLTLDSQGACSVTAHQAGGADNTTVWNPAPDVTVEFDVTTPALSVTTASLADATIGALYDEVVEAVGGVTPYAWNVTSGALPNGLQLVAATGHISGMPTLTGAGTFTVEATDADDTTADANLSLTVNDMPALANPPLDAGEVAVSYLEPLNVTGGSGPGVWSIVTGRLPLGLAIDASTGSISGLPTTAEVVSFGVQMTDANDGIASQAMSIAIAPLPTIAMASPTGARVGSPYRFAPTRTGGARPFTWSVSGGALPRGLTLNPATGMVGGTPGRAGTSTVALRVVDHGAQRATRLFRFDVRAPASGYRLAGADGGVFAFGNARFRGSLAALRLDAPVVGLASAAGGNGYWLVAADGGVFAFGSARFAGSLGRSGSDARIVGIAPTRDSRGYWLAASDGRVFAFGTARSYGQLSAARLGSPVVGIAAAPDGGGYWLANRAGALFAFGGAHVHGRIDADRLSGAAVVGLAAGPSGDRVWLVSTVGTVYAFGDARLHGSLSHTRLHAPIVGMSSTEGGRGYWLAGADGGVFAFGDAPFRGSGAPQVSPHVVGVAAAR
ncbi:MAG: Esterase [Actinomycetia bacterium]|nr:Esterase [Actinomycetes bacterium]